ncbi:MAG TPA: ATP-binding protein, partial [Myxococcus sp.]|nr:ATP-binding protein [Myxococcus sp.]
MSSNKGVSRVLRRELDEVATGKLKRLETVMGFDMRDGMRSTECNGNTQPSGWRGQDGRLWFTNLRGAIVVDPVRVRVSRRPPEVRIEEVKVQGQPVPVTDRVELTPGQSRLEIQFTAFTPADASGLRFQYRLKNHDDSSWVSSEVRTATYTALRPGSYVFEVKAEGRDGGWTEPVSLVVGVESKLWQRTWFLLLCVLGTVALGVSVYRLRVGQLKKRERWLAERVRERTQELARANQDLETNMRTLRQTQAQLVQAGRMAAVGQLAAGVGHEINNPLAYIVSNLEHASGEAEALARELGDAQGVGPRLRDVSQALREALHGADRVRRIVRDLRTFSRPDDEKQGAVELHAVLDSAVKIAMGELRPRAKLMRDYGDVPLVEGNEARLAQVFLNLLVNAAQALPEGRADENEVRLVTRLGQDGTVVAEVRDTGSGIAPEALGRIFDPFFTTKPVGVGTGLGLSLCHAYLSAMGGTISVESEVGRGSVFRVVLRRSKDSAPAVPYRLERSSGAFATVGASGAGQASAPVSSGAHFVSFPAPGDAGRPAGGGSAQPPAVGEAHPAGPAPATAGAAQPLAPASAAGSVPPASASTGGAAQAPAPAASDTATQASPEASASQARGLAAQEAPLRGPRVELPAQDPGAAPAPERGRVLVVDDDALVSGAIRRTLARENDVEVLVSARQALARLNSPDTRYDVVLCDLMMPEMTGMDLYDALVKASPQVAKRVVFITGGAFTPSARNFLERVENPRVEKPFDPETLRALVRTEVARVRGSASGRAA